MLKAQRKLVRIWILKPIGIHDPEVVAELLVAPGLKLRRGGAVEVGDRRCGAGVQVSIKRNLVQVSRTAATVPAVSAPSVLS